MAAKNSMIFVNIHRFLQKNSLSLCRKSKKTCIVIFIEKGRARTSYYYSYPIFSKSKNSVEERHNFTAFFRVYSAWFSLIQMSQILSSDEYYSTCWYIKGQSISVPADQKNSSQKHITTFCALQTPALRLFLNRLFRHRSKKISKLRVTGLRAGNSPEASEFPAQMTSNAENVSIWWRHHSYMTEHEYHRE